jgi:diguanylate cyclase (GGDEF)-like protein
MSLVSKLYKLVINNDFNKNFEIELAKSNMFAAKIMMSFIILAQVWDIFYTILKKKNIFAFPNYAYMILYISLFIASVIILLVVIKLSKNIEVNAKKILTLSSIYIGIILIWGTGITLLDFKNTDQIIVYITVVIGIAATIYTKPIITIILLSMNFIIFIALVINYETILPNFKLATINTSGLCINLTIFTFMGISTSIVRYLNKYQDFRNRNIIVSQNEKLYKLNNELNRLNSHLKGISKTDSLSKLCNRWSLDETMPVTWKDSIEKNANLAVLMMDIDNFKKINDSFGHDIGDKGIKLVSSIIKKYSEKFSLSSFRYGGEEFLILMPNFNMSDANKVANDIRQDICSSKIECTDINMTISGGLYCGTPSIDVEHSEFIVKADKALYKAKQKGKNYIELY